MTSVEGALTIDKNGEITTLAGLGELQSLGSLTIEENPKLLNLTGLNKLSQVNGSLKILLNESLVDISGLAGLSGTVGGDLEINGSEGLTSIAALSGVTGTTGYVYIVSTGVLSTAGLENLETIGTDLELSFNKDLSDISQLAKLTMINGNVQLMENVLLASLDGLGGITSVGGYLRLFQLEAITNLSAITSLDSIGGFFEINDNDNLRTVGELGAVTVGGEFRILKNICLPDQGVVDYFASGEITSDDEPKNMENGLGILDPEVECPVTP